MKIYDLVRQILTESKYCRDCDKELIWEVWKRQKVVTSEYNALFGMTEVLSKDAFLRAETPETITRARRKVQEDHKELSASDNVKNKRSSIASKKGYFVYHEVLK